MELWIRSQSKLSLVEAKTLNIIEREGKWHIVKLNASLNLECRIELGIYKTKERALEVLDEIQNILKPKLKIVQTDDMSLPIMNGEWVNSIREKMEFDTIQLSAYVYEMPEE